MKNQIKQLVLMLFLLISGCTTLQDFQKMNVSNRAYFVCQHDESFVSYTNEVNHYQNKINTIAEDLHNGYKMRETCRTVHHKVPDPITCKSFDKKKKEYTQCTQSYTKQTKKICKEVIVPINIELEKENLERYNNWLEVSRIKKTQAYDSCYSKVLPMSAETAFSYYKMQ